MADSQDKERYLLVWLGWWNGQIIRPTLGEIRREIEDRVKLPRDRVDVDIWLESPGGDAHVAYKLALMLRDFAGHIRVVIPDYAKSAATLLALVGDEIYMAPGAELGPLDAQVPDEGNVMGSVSALNIAHAADAVAEDAVTLAVNAGATMLRETRLSRADTLKMMLSFSAAFSEPLVRQLNPILVHQAKELLNVTVRYAEQILEKTTGDEAKRIARELVENCPTHGFVIAYEHAHRLGLPVKHIEEYDLLSLLRPLHRATEAQMEPFIKFAALDDFLHELEPDDTPDNGSGKEVISDDKDESAVVHRSSKPGRGRSASKGSALPKRGPKTD